MVKLISIRIAVVLSVTLFCGCDMFNTSESTPQDAKPVQSPPDAPIELSPEHNQAFVDAMKPAIGQAIANIANEFSVKMFEALEISDEIESSLINPGLNGLEHTDDAITTVYLFRHQPDATTIKTTVLSIDGHIALRLVRIPTDAKVPYAIIHHQSHSLSLIVERFLVYNADSGWQKQDNELQRREISFGDEPAG